MLTVPPLWPMTTRERSTPSSLKMRCCSRPHGSGGRGVCVVMGTPVARWARATARRTRSHPGRHAGFIGGAFENSRSHARLRDALTDFPYEHLDHGLGSAEDRARSLEVEEHRHVVVGVDAGGDDDIDFRHQVRDGFDAGDVATQADDREVDERVDPLALELLQLGHCPCLLRLFVPFRGGLLDLRTQDEDVLVHEGPSQGRSLHWPPHGVDLRHSPPSRCPARPPAAATGGSYRPAA